MLRVYLFRNDKGMSLAPTLSQTLLFGYSHLKWGWFVSGDLEPQTKPQIFIRIEATLHPAAKRSFEFKGPESRLYRGPDGSASTPHVTLCRTGGQLDSCTGCRIVCVRLRY